MYVENAENSKLSTFQMYTTNWVSRNENAPKTLKPMLNNNTHSHAHTQTKKEIHAAR